MVLDFKIFFPFFRAITTLGKNISLQESFNFIKKIPTDCKIQIQYIICICKISSKKRGGGREKENQLVSINLSKYSLFNRHNRNKRALHPLRHSPCLFYGHLLKLNIRYFRSDLLRGRGPPEAGSANAISQ